MTRIQYLMTSLSIEISQKAKSGTSHQHEGSVEPKLLNNTWLATGDLYGYIIHSIQKPIIHDIG